MICDGKPNRSPSKKFLVQKVRKKRKSVQALEENKRNGTLTRNDQTLNKGREIHEDGMQCIFVKSLMHTRNEGKPIGNGVGSINNLLNLIYLYAMHDMHIFSENNQPKNA